MVRCHEKRFQTLSGRPLIAKVSEAQIEALFNMLDLDKNGALDHNEILGVLNKRVNLGQGKESEVKDQVKSQLSGIISMLREKTGL